MAEIGFSQAGLGRFAGPGHWNDPDMLEVGNGGMRGGSGKLDRGISGGSRLIWPKMA
jgi:hypothetical protein